MEQLADNLTCQCVHQLAPTKPCQHHLQLRSPLSCCWTLAPNFPLVAAHTLGNSAAWLHAQLHIRNVSWRESRCFGGAHSSGHGIASFLAATGWADCACISDSDLR